jgi:hypothetical protein
MGVMLKYCTLCLDRRRVERETERYTYLELEHRDVKTVSSKSCTTQFLHENSAVVPLNNYQVLPPQIVRPTYSHSLLSIV